ncbi:hypothetical protein BCL69_10339 [Nitrosomonas communis]|uniref:Uncharacterized protein n=1 Tax=Nitrosomonas communis TaxID=44574 RepID=A0A1H2WRX3_9PROT|nr:hypothetical protein BCL69_10339 [Nitrosomonas communis]SDW83216.1 hypothetical protein SAMN05421882_10315 [Nitrosomonas communis]
MKKGTLPIFIVFMHKKNNMALEPFCNILCNQRAMHEKYHELELSERRLL